jgi:hypothetical protein
VPCVARSIACMRFECCRRQLRSNAELCSQGTSANVHFPPSMRQTAAARRHAAPPLNARFWLPGGDRQRNLKLTSMESGCKPQFSHMAALEGGLGAALHAGLALSQLRRGCCINESHRWGDVPGRC